MWYLVQEQYASVVRWIYAALWAMMRTAFVHALTIQTTLQNGYTVNQDWEIGATEGRFLG